MSRRLSITPAAALVSLTLMGVCFAQIPSQSISGDVEGADRYPVLLVEVYDLSSHMVVERQPITTSGHFEIRTTSSSYELRVATPSGEVIGHADAGTVRNGPITIQLPQHQKSGAGGAGGVVVSLRDLKREGNKKLKKEFAAAQEAVARGDLEASASHLERAVAIDPTYVPAYVNLGARYIQLHQPNRARGALLRAIELDPTFVMAYTNLAVADFNRGDSEAAAAALTAALRISPNDPLANRLLAAASQTGASNSLTASAEHTQRAGTPAP